MARRRLFGALSASESRTLADILRTERAGGLMLLVGAAIALIWVNSPWAPGYESMRAFTFGPESLHLHLSLSTWVQDGLLAIFFFVIGLELKREMVAGELRKFSTAIVPAAAAVGGMVAPALIYLGINAAQSGGSLKGWAIPTATDIAFALAVLAVIGTFLPVALRTFLLTLAVVDDLLAIVIIALFYTSELAVAPLLAALAPLAAFALLVRRGVRSWWLLLPAAFAVWALVHASGVHATVAGVLLAFTVPVRGAALAEHFEHRFRPLSAGVAVPLFAFLAAGVPLGGLTGVAAALTDPVAVGIMLGLVAGKPLGIMAATWLVARFTHARLDEDLRWSDVLGLAMLGGIGFTVSLLIGELAFGDGAGPVKLAVLAGSLAAAVLAAVILRLRNRAYRLAHEARLARETEVVR